MKNEKTYILVADDEKEIRDILKLLLEGEGYEVLAVEDGSQVLEAASEKIDLYILDVNMPKMTGFMAAMELRKTYDTPIVFLTAYSGEMDKVMGFSAGADDYIVKPFSNMELLMRVKAILRRSNAGKFAVASSPADGTGTIDVPQLSKRQIIFSDLILDLDNQSVIRGQEVISLTFTEFKILELLVSHKKKIYSMDNIYQSIWEEEAVADSAIMVHIKNIRKKIGDDSRNPKYIKTAWGKGYYVD
jgi:DNA-binding response OmpR family regulator